MKLRSFKLVKEYPGSSALNTVFTSTEDGKLYKNWGTYLDPADVEDNPEFFEEIIEEEYEILELYTTNHNDHYFLREDGNYSFKGVEYGNSFKTCQEYGWKIFSIKRLSDNEVFSIGDELVDTFNRNQGKFTLKEIEFEKAPCDKGTGKLSFVHTHTILGKYIPLERLEKPKPVLFVTHDGYEMFEGFLVHLICLPLTSTQVYNFERPFKIPENWRPQSYVETFFQIHNAEEFVFKNKPVLSLEDVASIYPGINKEHNSPSHQAEQLKALVKSRL